MMSYSAPAAYAPLNDILDDLDDLLSTAQQAARKGQPPGDILQALADLDARVRRAIRQAAALRAP